MRNETQRPTAAFLAVIAASFALYFLMMRLQECFADTTAIFSYGEWYSKCAAKRAIVSGGWSGT